jgi:hypothetical protein
MERERTMAIIVEITNDIIAAHRNGVNKLINVERAPLRGVARTRAAKR